LISRRRALACGLCALLAGAAAGRAAAYEIDEHLEVYGYSQAWLTVYEQMEEARGLFQHPSGDEATDVASGFRLHRARAGLRARVLDGLLGLDFQLKLEQGVEILDLALRLQPLDELRLLLGQFKIPSTRENRDDDQRLDFLLRSELSVALADYALSRTTYVSSLFYGNRSLTRDFGLGLVGELELGGHPLRAFFMLGNGLGGNLFVGGSTNREFLVSNRGQFFYALRLDVGAVPGWLELGGHASYNRHDDVVFNSGRVVLDLERLSWSADACLTLGPSGLRLVATYGQVFNLEDAFGDGKTDQSLEGWELRLVWRLNPLLVYLGLSDEVLAHHAFELAARYEEVSAEADESGMPSTRRNVTVGVSYLFREYLVVRFNAILHRTDEPFLPDLDDDAYILGVQASF